MTQSLHRQLILTVDRIALKLAKRALTLLDSGDDADLAKATELFQALTHWAADRGLADDGALVMGGSGTRQAGARRVPIGAAARLAGLIAELPTSLERPRDGAAHASEPTA